MRTSGYARGAMVMLSLGWLGCAPGHEPPTTDEPSGARRDASLACFIDPERSLLVRDPSVVDDVAYTTGKGPWGFGHIIRELASEDVSAESLASTLGLGIASAANPTCTEGSMVPCWPHLQDGKLDVDNLPVTLVAVVNRSDLTSPENPIGEARLIYQTLWDEIPCCAANRRPLPRFYNFEYDLGRVRDDEGEPLDRLAWARAWRDLSALPLGSAEYKEALADLVSIFARRGAAPDYVNGSALRAIRMSSEQWYPGTGLWELRSFELLPSATKVEPAGALTTMLLDNTPESELNTFPPYSELAPALVANESAILDGSFELPLVTESGHIVHGAVSITGTVGSRWLGPNALDASSWSLPEDWSTERFDAVATAFGERTCDGCHGFYTQAPGHHLHAREPGERAELSSFLREQEIPRRVDALRALACPDDLVVSCADHCGGPGPGAACYCDELCAALGDCCADKEAVCD